MVLSLVYIVGGLALLIKSADWLVDGASSVARRLGIPAIVVGLTIVAFGTSAPELVVNLIASARGNVDIAIGNIVGSNIANIFLILGVAAAIFPLKATAPTVYKEIPFVLLSALVLGVLASDALIDGSPSSLLGRADGIILLSFFIIFLFYTYGRSQVDYYDDGHVVKVYGGWQSCVRIVGGIVGLTLGGKLAIDGSVAVAEIFGLSEALIGLTIIVVGTSLPELATSAVAAFKKNADIAIGNVVGSNIFNTFWILGVSALVRPLPFSLSLQIDVMIAIFASVFLFAVMFIGKKYIVQQYQGFIFVTFYFAYLAFIIWRG